MSNILPKNIPSELPLLPIKNRVLLPGSALKLTIGRAKSVSLVESLWNGKGRFNKPNTLVAIFTQKEGSAEHPNDGNGGELNLYEVGTVGRIFQLSRAGTNRYNMLVQGVCRFRFKKTTKQQPFFICEGEVVKDVGSANDADVKATALQLKQAAKELFDTQKNRNGNATKLSTPTRDFLNTINKLPAGQLADVLTGTLEGKVAEKYEVLKEEKLKDRLEKALTMVQKQVEVFKISKKIQNQVEGNLKNSQREYYLRQQLKAIQKELGEGAEEGDVDEIKVLKDRLEAMPLPPDARKVVTRELKRIGRMQPVQPEYSMIQTYLEWMADLPWGKYSDDAMDIVRVKEQLDEDHYGLEKVKKRLVEYLAIKQLHQMKERPSKDVGAGGTEESASSTEEGEEAKSEEAMKEEEQTKSRSAGAILCLLGPPGVGKTSLGNSVAKALGRTFHRMALGGVRDEAELRGHRRTYIGSMPGNIIAGMKKAGTQNPVMLLDEIDKLGRDFRGDPASALLEILDPEQNSHFVDHYINSEFDLSEVLFFATANDLATIPGPLRDRMEIIQLPGYTMNEKVAIAERHLVRRAVERHALEPEDFKLPTESLKFLIRSYTREAGVRGLERDISALCRNIAVRVAEWSSNGSVGKFYAPVLTPELVEEIMGPVRFQSETAMRVTVPGVSTGLAWTSVGGELLFIECTRYRGSGGLKLTGQLGDVMKESAQIALSWIRANTVELGLQEQSVFEEREPLFKFSDVHIHFPAGAIPKDGPSAGVAITSALSSLFLDKLVRSDTAMTGEISLRGKVLPVGGIKEKCLAAHREGLRRVVLPSKNKKDVVEIPEEIRNEMEIILVDRVEEALDAVLEGGLEFGYDETKRALPPFKSGDLSNAASNIAAIADDELLSNL